MTQKLRKSSIMFLFFFIARPPVAAQEAAPRPQVAGHNEIVATALYAPISPQVSSLRRSLETALPPQKLETLAIPLPPSGTWGIVSSGDGGGAIFRDSDSEAEAWLGADTVGVYGFGSNYGGHFEDSDSTGYARVGIGDYGIQAYGNDGGGYFQDRNGSAWVVAAQDDIGVLGYGNSAGGYFQDLDSGAFSYLGSSETGVLGSGESVGGYFKDSDDSGYGRIGYGDLGVEGHGNEAGGYFKDIDGSGYAYVGYGGTGIEASGDEGGGYFTDEDDNSWAYIGSGSYGVRGAGVSAGGYFADSEASGYAFVGHGDYGISGYGNVVGGYFKDIDGSGYAYPGIGDTGIEGYGNYAGGFFDDLDGDGWARVGHDTHKIDGNGTVNFVQNHPYDPSAVIFYTALEGDEVATYTRGTARLVDGEANVELGSTFKWVTNPDIGLTAHLTPVGRGCDLFIAEKGTEKLVVRSENNADCTFDYIVYGLRIGFEETTVVQEKTREARIPSMNNHRMRLAQRPDLAGYTAMARWKRQEIARGVEAADINLSRAAALTAAITEYDPEVHGPVGHPPDTQENTGDLAGEEAETQTAARTEHGIAVENPSMPRTKPSINQVENQDLYARSFRPSAGDLSTLVQVSEEVEAGDVLVISPDGQAQRSDTASAPTVLGVVAADPGVVLGDDGKPGQHAAMAFSGIARCKVDATFGPIYPGDLLVTSPTPGHAMRGDVPAPGTVLGKALESHSDGEGIIRILVMMR